MKYAKELIVLLLCLVSIKVFAQIKVAVIDTGIDQMNHDAPLCPGLSRDFTGTGLTDTNGHGSHVSDTIDQHVKGLVRNNRNISDYASHKDINANYCQVILKFYDPNAQGNLNAERSIEAIQYAVDNKVNIINYSAGGTQYISEERHAIEQALNGGIKFVAAAGNDGQNFDNPAVVGYRYYPAMYDRRIIVVGNLDDSGTNTIRHFRSNYGSRVTRWELGTGILAQLPNNHFGLLTGTSQACASATGQIIHNMLYYK